MTGERKPSGEPGGIVAVDGRWAPRRINVIIVAAYFAFAILWVVVAEHGSRLAAAQDPASVLAHFRHVREWLFVAFTGLVLLLLLRTRARAEQHAAHARLKDETRIRSILESSMLGVAIWDSDLRLVEANDAFLRMTGYSRADMGGLTAGKLGGNSLAHLKNAATYTSFEADLVRKDGKRVPALIGGRFLGGDLGEGVTFVLDLTESRRTQDSLERARTQVDALLENAPIILWSVDNSGIFTYSSGKGLKSLGLGPGQVIGKSVFDIFKVQDGALSAIRRVLGGAGPQQVVTRNGDAWHQNQMLPLMDADGKIAGIIGVSLDIDDLKKAEAELLRSRRLLLDAQRIGRVGSWEFDYATQAASWTDEMYRIFGVDRSTFTPSRETVSAMMPVEDAIAMGSTSANARARGEPWSMEHRIVRPSGEIRHVVENAEYVLDDGGRVVRSIGTCRDITEQRELEEQVRQASKMEAVGRLAGGIAHDFNNLLTAIMGHTEMLQLRLGSDTRAAADIEKVMKAAGRAAEMTRQLLALGRRQVLQPRVFDLNAVVNDTDAMLRRLIGEHIKIHLHLAKDLGRVRADPGQMGQVLMNLTLNARDAMPKGGAITIETANVHLDDEYARMHAGVTPGPHVMVSVTDTGTGMDAATQARIFEPFFTTKDPGKGTGLGLSIVHGIITQSGGHLYVYSRLGHGTVFKVFLPRVDAEAEAPVEELPAAPSRGGETILLVEDDEDVREMLLEFLDDQGYTLIAAGQGSAALRQADEHLGKIQLMITDVIMPGMSGTELAEEIAKARPEMKMLFISGYSFNAITSRGLSADNLNLLEKPFSLDALARKVREVLDG
ncbi:MAG: PAS domain S-box protein [Planctomycetes bacterium]|nr:PAS domain S-box protein [Planctomycetota bacterium]